MKRWLYSAMVWLLLAGSAFALTAVSIEQDQTITGQKTLERAILDDPHQLTDNVVAISKYADFPTAISTIGSSTQTTLLIDRLTTVASNTTVTSNITLWFVGSGKLSINSGVTVTINGPLIASPRQIFSGSGTVLLGTAIPIVYVEWFGAVRDGSTDDASAINATLAALPSDGATVQLLGGRYRTGSAINLVRRLRLRGVGYQAIGNFSSSTETAILPQFNGNALILTFGSSTAADTILENFAVFGDKATYTTNTNTGIKLNNATDVKLRELVVDNFAGYNLDITGGSGIWAEDVYAPNAGVYNLRTNAPTTKLDNFQSDGAPTSVRIETGADNFWMTRSHIEGTTVSGVSINATATARIKLLGNFIADTPKGITIEGTATRLQIHSNTLLGNSAAGSVGIESLTSSPNTFSVLGNIVQSFQIAMNHNSFGSDIIVGNVLDGQGVGGIGLQIVGPDKPSIVASNEISGQLHTIRHVSGNEVDYVGNVTTDPATDNRKTMTIVAGTPRVVSGINESGTATFATAATVSVTFSVAEPDTNYRISIGGQANETFWITSKATSGFTLNSSNASSVATVEWHLTRG